MENCVWLQRLCSVLPALRGLCQLLAVLFWWLRCFSLWCNGMISGLTTHYKYPENGDLSQSCALLSSFWNKDSNNHFGSQTIPGKEYPAQSHTTNSIVLIKKCVCEDLMFFICFVHAVQLWHHSGHQFRYAETDPPMYNTVMIFCVWNKSGAARITIVVALILIINAYLFVMDIK